MPRKCEFHNTLIAKVLTYADNNITVSISYSGNYTGQLTTTSRRSRGKDEGCTPAGIQQFSTREKYRQSLAYLTYLLAISYNQKRFFDAMPI